MGADTKGVGAHEASFQDKTQESHRVDEQRENDGKDGPCIGVEYQSVRGRQDETIGSQEGRNPDEGSSFFGFKPPFHQVAAKDSLQSIAAVRNFHNRGDRFSSSRRGTSTSSRRPGGFR